MNQVQGKVWHFGNNVDTDLIIPARYLNTIDPKELAAHCMEDADPGFAGKVNTGDIIVAGKNFGCGSSREHAPIALKAAGVRCVVAASFARIFYRNSINIGLPILECPEASAAVAEGDRVTIDFNTGTITDTTNGKAFQAGKFSSFMQELIAAGGLIEYVKKSLNT